MGISTRSSCHERCFIKWPPISVIVGWNFVRNLFYRVMIVSCVNLLSFVSLTVCFSSFSLALQFPSVLLHFRLLLILYFLLAFFALCFISFYKILQYRRPTRCLIALSSEAPKRKITGTPETGVTMYEYRRPYHVINHPLSIAVR